MKKLTSSSASQEIPDILWNLKVHYSAHKSPPLVCILTYINPVHGMPVQIKIHFNIIIPAFTQLQVIHRAASAGIMAKIVQR